MLLRRAPPRGAWRTSSRAGVSSLTTPQNALAAATIVRGSSPSLTRMHGLLQTRRLTTHSCMRWPTRWWGRSTDIIRSGGPRRSRSAVQDTAVTTCNSPHCAPSSRATMRAGSRLPSSGSVAPCVARAMARCAIRPTQRNAGSRHARDRKEQGASACVAAVSTVSRFPLVMWGTLCPLCMAIGTPFSHQSADERALSWSAIGRTMGYAVAAQRGIRHTETPQVRRAAVHGGPRRCACLGALTMATVAPPTPFRLIRRVPTNTKRWRPCWPLQRGGCSGPYSCCRRGRAKPLSLPCSCSGAVGARSSWHTGMS